MVRLRGVSFVDLGENAEACLTASKAPGICRTVSPSSFSLSSSCLIDGVTAETNTGNVSSSYRRRRSCCSILRLPMSSRPPVSASSFSPLCLFDLSANCKDRRVLSVDQLGRCSNALNFFRRKLKNADVIRKEFDFLQDGWIGDTASGKTCSVALSRDNLKKNRYSDVVPFDDNRIILDPYSQDRQSIHGYVNASLITNWEDERVSQFIATQGPLPHTIEDFWTMIFQYGCPVIVMLTRLVDSCETVKCADYFQADDGPREFGSIIINTKWIKVTENLVLRYLEVESRKSEDPPHPVLHIQYADWPDHGVPTDTAQVREIFKRICVVPRNLGPIAVHCSAGIGRTGSYCVIHNTIQRVIYGDTSALEVDTTVANFRSQRSGMVQTMGQFFFCFNAIIDELEDILEWHKRRR